MDLPVVERLSKAWCADSVFGVKKLIPPHIPFFLFFRISRIFSVDAAIVSRAAAFLFLLFVVNAQSIVLCLPPRHLSCSVRGRQRAWLQRACYAKVSVAPLRLWAALPLCP